MEWCTHNSPYYTTVHNMHRCRKFECGLSYFEWKVEWSKPNGLFLTDYLETPLLWVYRPRVGRIMDDRCVHISRLERPKHAIACCRWGFNWMSDFERLQNSRRKVVHIICSRNTQTDSNSNRTTFLIHAGFQLRWGSPLLPNPPRYSSFPRACLSVTVLYFVIDISCLYIYWLSCRSIVV